MALEMSAKRIRALCTSSDDFWKSSSFLHGVVDDIRKLIRKREDGGHSLPQGKLDMLRRLQSTVRDMADEYEARRLETALGILSKFALNLLLACGNNRRELGSIDVSRFCFRRQIWKVVHNCIRTIPAMNNTIQIYGHWDNDVSTSRYILT